MSESSRLMLSGEHMGVLRLLHASITPLHKRNHVRLVIEYSHGRTGVDISREEALRLSAWLFAQAHKWQA